MLDSGYHLHQAQTLSFSPRREQASINQTRQQWKTHSVCWLKAEGKRGFGMNGGADVADEIQKPAFLKTF